MASFHLGELHPAIIHFPIALIFTALAFDLLYWYTRKNIFNTLADWFVIVVALFLIPVAVTGFLAKDFYPANDPDVLRHQNMALATAAYTIAHAIFRAYALYKHELYSVYLYLILILINVGLVNTTAEFGGIVVRGKGITTDSLRPTGSPLPYGHVERGK